VISSVRGDRRGTELAAESELNALELWHKQSGVIGAGMAKFKYKANPLVNPTLLVSIEPKKVSAH